MMLLSFWLAQLVQHAHQQPLSHLMYVLQIKFSQTCPYDIYAY